MQHTTAVEEMGTAVTASVAVVGNTVAGAAPVVAAAPAIAVVAVVASVEEGISTEVTAQLMVLTVSIEVRQAKDVPAKLVVLGTA